MKQFFIQLKNTGNTAIHYINSGKNHVMEKMRSGAVEKNRLMVLFISLLIVLDYLMFCYHTEKNVFSLIPSLPVLSAQKKHMVYLPNPDGTSLIPEKRRIVIPDTNEEFVIALFKTLVRGSIYENTSMAFPIETYIRRVWFHEDSCIIDLELPHLKNNISVIPGSEKNFLNAVQKTITENIPSVKRVLILNKGIPDRPLWEIAGK